MTHTLSRRRFGAISAITAAGLAFGLPIPKSFGRMQDKPAGVFDWCPLKRNATVAFGQGGNALAIRTPAGGLLIDCKVCGYASELRRGAEKHAGTLQAVINTHHHGDHTGGNHAFAKDLPLIAHANAAPRIADQLERYKKSAHVALKQLFESDSPADAQALKDADELVSKIDNLLAKNFAPTRTIESAHTMMLGNVDIHLTHPGPGHTDNDLIVHIPSFNLVHTGDLLFHEVHPYVDRPAGATTRGWQRSLEATIKLCDQDTKVVPGHGEITDIAGLRKQIEYFDVVREHVRRAMNQGKKREEITDSKIDAHKDYGFEGLRSSALGAIYEELTL